MGVFHVLQIVQMVPNHATHHKLWSFLKQVHITLYLKTTPEDYKPEKINGVFNDRYIEYKSDGSEYASIKQYFEKIRHHIWVIW